MKAISMSSHAKPQRQQPSEPPLPTEDELLDEALDETFPASDPVQPSPRDHQEAERRRKAGA